MADNKLIIDNINEEEGIAWLILNRPAPNGRQR